MRSVPFAFAKTTGEMYLPRRKTIGASIPTEQQTIQRRRPLLARSTHSKVDSPRSWMAIGGADSKMFVCSRTVICSLGVCFR